MALHFDVLNTKINDALYFQIVTVHFLKMRTRKFADVTALLISRKITIKFQNKFSFSFYIRIIVIKCWIDFITR